MTSTRVEQMVADIKDDIRLGLAQYAYEETIALVRLLRKLGYLRGMTPVKNKD